ncbi:unnamed protein product [Clonostachys byssicola]|uniref:Protein kinase domain-containing protein n=1 Tax=Clonostachys byssicola TaxID=160290 RepID=A0A9N9UB05_9HYPO|nr:unnamed protein product [Clonostachys byssicola]
MDAGSLAVGTVAAVPGLITSCIQLYGHVQTWKQRRPDLDNYFIKLHFNQERLKVYEELMLGFQNRGRSSLLEDLLHSIQKDLNSLEALLKKHDEKLGNKKKPISYIAADEPQISKLTERLTGNTNILEDLLPDTVKDHVRYRIRNNVLGPADLEALSKFSRVDMDKDNRDLVVEAQIRYLTMSMAKTSQGMNAGDNHFRYRDKIRWLQMPDMSKSQPTWNNNCQLSELDGHDRTFGVLPEGMKDLASRRLLVEWRPEFKRRDQDPINPANRLNQLTYTLREMSEAANPSVQDLSNPVNFRILRCEGWVTSDLNHKRTGLVFTFPKSLGQVPVSLHDRINQTQKRNLPDLNVRLDMARALSRSIANWIAIKWLHRAFRSDNVLLFEPEAYKELYVVGHSYTRPDSGIGDLSTLQDTNSDHMLYRPPPDMTGWWDVKDPLPAEGAIGQTVNPIDRVRRIDAGFDVFALGIVLLELGYWRTVSSLKKEYQRKDSKLKFNQAALLFAADHLGFKTGTRYRDVVVRCLELKDWLSGKSDPEQFMAQVLRDLNSCRV